MLTTAKGYRYPEGSDPPDLRILLKALADDVDAKAALASALPSVQTFTPAVTGVGVSAGTVTGEYLDLFGWILGRVQFKVSGAPTGEVKVGLPVPTRALTTGIHTFGIADVRDDSAGIYVSGKLEQVVDVAGPITASTIYLPASSTNTNSTKVASGTFPFPWAAGDQIAYHFSYAKG